MDSGDIIEVGCALILGMLVLAVFIGKFILIFVGILLVAFLFSRIVSGPDSGDSGTNINHNVDDERYP
jgi:hypothetical protein